MPDSPSILCFSQTGGRLKHVIDDVMEGTMRICLDKDNDSTNHYTFDSATRREQREGVSVAPRDGHSAAAEGRVTALKTSAFSLVLDEQWRGTAEAPSMKMV